MPQCMHRYHVKTIESHLIYGRNYSVHRWELCDEGLIPHRRRNARSQFLSAEDVERKAQKEITYISEKDLEAPPPRTTHAGSKSQRFQQRAEQRKKRLQETGKPESPKARLGKKKDKVR